MCGSMADIQSAAAEIRRGKKKKEERRRTNHSMKIYMVSLFHRATIKKTNKIYIKIYLLSEDNRQTKTAPLSSSLNEDPVTNKAAP